MVPPKTFRPDGVGSRQRRLHFGAAAAGLLAFVAVGTPALFAYLAGVMLLHLRPDRIRGRNLMEILLDAHALALGRAWNAFAAWSRRRTVALAAPRPTRWLGAAWILVMLGLGVVLGERVADARLAIGLAARAAFALAASGALWVSLFGLARRAKLVVGTDGVLVGDTFVPYTTVDDIRRRDAAVVIGRGPSLPPVVVPTDEPGTADRLVHALVSAQDRGARRRAEPSAPLPAAGFREEASNVGWRVRVLDATSDEERRAVIARVAPDDLRALLDETADPTLEEAVEERVKKAT